MGEDKTLVFQGVGAGGSGRTQTQGDGISATVQGDSLRSYVCYRVGRVLGGLMSGSHSYQVRGCCGPAVAAWMDRTGWILKYCD